MRILFVGYLGRGQTSGMRCEALRRLGHEVVSVDAGAFWRGASYFARQFQQLTLHGARIESLNAAVLDSAIQFRPELIWAEKQEYLKPATLETLRRSGSATLHYNPDPYFSVDWKRTSLTDECLLMYDTVVVTKRYEMGDYSAHGCEHVLYSPLGYDIKGHAAPQRSPAPNRDVVFIGGWEPRREQLLALAQSHAATSVWGYGWEIAQHSRADPLRAIRLGRLTPGSRTYFGAPRKSLSQVIMPGEGRSGEIFDESYLEAVASARIALGLLREAWPDQHTTRTFEIPAIGSFMLADRTPEHLEFFEEGVEAEYFDSEEEFSDKIKFYLSNDDARRRIALAGHTRCLRSGYSYDDRIRRILCEVVN